MFKSFDKNVVVDIGADCLSFKEMMQQAGNAMNLKRRLLPVPVLSPRLSSYWLILFTPVPFKIAAALIEGLKSETVLLNDNAKRHFPEIQPLPFKSAVEKAMAEIEDNQVVSRWCDADSGEACDIEHNDKELTTVFRDQYRFDIQSQNREQIFQC